MNKILNIVIFTIFPLLAGMIIGVTWSNSTRIAEIQKMVETLSGYHTEDGNQTSCQIGACNSLENLVVEKVNAALKAKAEEPAKSIQKNVEESQKAKAEEDKFIYIPVVYQYKEYYHWLINSNTGKYVFIKMNKETDKIDDAICLIEVDWVSPYTEKYLNYCRDNFCNQRIHYNQELRCVQIISKDSARVYTDPRYFK